jgi:uncharacterized repeat protein (TIGR01451 family)
MGLFAVSVTRSVEHADPALEFHASGFQGNRLDTGVNWMKRSLLGVLAGLVLLAMPGREACAMTASGSIVTNFASVTFTSINAYPYFHYENATTEIWIAEPPIIVLTKQATPTVGAPGDVITYEVCAFNQSWNFSAMNITVNDWLPDNTGYEQTPANWNWVNTPGAVWTRSCSGDDVTYTGGEPGAGQTPAQYFKWFLNMMGPRDSGCVTFKATIQ